MPTVLVLGAGLMGPAIVRDLLRFEIADRVILTDADTGRLQRAAAWIADRRCETRVLNIWDRPALLAAMREADVVAGAYPVAAVREVTSAAVEAGVHLADLTGSAEGFDIFDYHEAAAAAGVTLLPGCGVGPGLTNALAGQGAARFDRPDEGVIYVGGLPLHPRPPFNYTLVFSLETLIDEYVAPVLVVQDGRTVEVPALDGLEHLTFPEPIGACEAFYTYGLGTLARTGPRLGFRNLCEKTVRYPGHRDLVAFLRDCGFFRQDPVEVDGATVVPRRLAVRLLEPLLRSDDPRDVTVVRVVVRGERGGERGRWVFEMVDRYDEAEGVTSMARTTAYTCSILVGMLLDGRIQARGVAPLEEVFADAGRYEALRQELARRDIHVSERYEPDPAG